MSATSLAELLATRLPRELADTARRLADAQGRVDRALPGALLGQVRVMRVSPAQLDLACASGAIASRLRHQTETLLKTLEKRGLAVAALRVHVRPELVAPWREPVEKAGIPGPGLAALETLDGEIEAGPLKTALDRLLRHHRGG
jgi:hypothetical protein